MNSATYKRAFKPATSVASVDGRNNLPPGGGTQPDGPSAGPMSTTSNVLNLADTQTIRLQESSIVSNVVNSNSGASNCSQKTPTTLSQQLVLTGVCSNCGSNQLTAAPMVNGHNTNISGNNASTKDKQVASSEFKPSQGTSNSGHSKQTNASNRWQPTTTSATGQYHNLGNNNKNQQNQQQQQFQSNQIDKNSYNVVSSSRPLGGSSNQIVTTAKILHNRIATPDSSASIVTARRQIKRNPSEEKVLANVHNHHSETTNSTANSNHGDCMNHATNKKRHMGSLNRLNEMTSFTSSDRHCIDESISSLVNDSFMNTSPDNTPCDAANGHMSSSVHRNIQCKGSDSMLCNQSLQSIDYCSDCCPSLCHCSCQICSSTNGGFENGSGTALCSHRHNSMSVTRAHEDDEDMPSGSGNLDDYDAMCILQLVHHGDCDADASINDDAAADNRSSSVELASDETGATLIKCRNSEEVDDTLVVGSKTDVTRTKASAAQRRMSSEFGSTADKDSAHDGGGKSSKARHAQTMEMRTIVVNRPFYENDTKQSSSTKIDKETGNFVQSGPTTKMKSASSRTSRKRSPSSKTSTGQQPAGPSVAHALQAAATSALGAATSQIIKSANIIDHRHHHHHHQQQQQQQQQQQETSSCGNSVSDVNFQQSLFGGSSKAISSPLSPSKHRKPHATSSYVGADKVFTGGTRHQDKCVQQRPTASAGQAPVGTIQASLELVRSDEARRKSIASSKQRRKSGCFNYHDDYEYSYGLVRSSSGSEQECYFGDETDACLDIGFGLKHSDQESLATGLERRDADMDDANRDGGARGGGKDEDNDDDDDDDFEHDGRVTLERHYFKRSDKDLKRESSLARRNKHQQQSSSKRRIKELELDEHRINSVALIAATLSAGGAIMDSGGTGAASATIDSDDNDEIIGDQSVASVSGSDRYQQTIKGINIDAEKSPLSSGQLLPQGMENKQQQQQQQQQQHKQKQKQKQTIETSSDRKGDEKATYLGTF